MSDEFVPVDQEAVKASVVETLKEIYDPEIPVNIYELGLVYGVDVAESGHVAIKMTLTSPACPVAGSLPPEVEEKVRALENVRSVAVDVVWDPPWDKDMMSDEAKFQLGLF